MVKATQFPAKAASLKIVGLGLLGLTCPMPTGPTGHKREQKVKVEGEMLDSFKDELSQKDHQGSQKSEDSDDEDLGEQDLNDSNNQTIEKVYS